MTEKIKLNLSSYPKMVQAFAKENFNLKMLALMCLTLTLVSLIVTAFLIKQGPVVIAIQGDGDLARLETKINAQQIEAAIKEYLERRYSWNSSNIQSELKNAEFFVDSELVLSFRKSMSETIKYVQEKKVSQRLYPKKNGVSVDLKEKVVTVLADRFTEFDGLKAATEARLKIWFTLGSLIYLNPWGVFVTKELEIGGGQ